MQKNEAFLIEENRPLIIKKYCISPMNIAGLQAMQMYTSHSKIRINEQGFTKFADADGEADDHVQQSRRRQAAHGARNAPGLYPVDDRRDERE